MIAKDLSAVKVFMDRYWNVPLAAVPDEARSILVAIERSQIDSQRLSDQVDAIHESILAYFAARPPYLELSTLTVTPTGGLASSSVA